MLKLEPEWVFGYISGALYALLLDEFDVDWKDDITVQTNLAQLLNDALNC